ncbi:MAG: PGPGW domain-containing protein [Actinobacteria bacterium]|nr:PGPGW domain-containing protein [Actinomycetota bacterium]
MLLVMARPEDTQEIRQDRTMQLPRIVAARSTRRVLIGLLGGALVLLGIILIPLPGPGSVLILLGLTVLGWEYRWAKRLLFKAKWQLKRLRSRRTKKTS